MAKTTWNTGDIITQKKMNLIESNIEALLNSTNSLILGVKSLLEMVDATEKVPIIELDSNAIEQQDIVTLDLNKKIKPIAEEVINEKIFTDWPVELNQDIIGIDSLAVGENTDDLNKVIVSGTALQNYIDNKIKILSDNLQNSFNNLKNNFYRQYVEGDILVTTYSREISNNDETKYEGRIGILGNKLSVEEYTLIPIIEDVYWIPFGQGRMLIGAGAGTDGENSKTFPVAEGQLEGGKYTHTSAISATATKPGVNTTKVTNSTKSIKVATSLKVAPEITIENETFDLIPPYVVVYFYKRCSKEEYNTYYNITEETETNSSSEGTENNTSSEGTSTDSGNP